MVLLKAEVKTLKYKIMCTNQLILVLKINSHAKIETKESAMTHYVANKANLKLCLKNIAPILVPKN